MAERHAEDTEIGIADLYSGGKIDVSRPQHEGGNINESYTKFYKAEVSHGEHIFLTRRETERPLLAENSRQHKMHKLSKLYNNK